uniref:Uncharacterized protein n=1 Tax=virus sp. ctx9V1 TaxID=2828001 RepID=A0A8S5RDS5_9VIRU|nr:MAG TPA: hypothetical protein [virus sp. ctx9V1]
MLGICIDIFTPQFDIAPYLPPHFTYLLSKS